jgi:hypothetical protein
MRLTCLDSVRGGSEAGSSLECSREVSVIAKAAGKGNLRDAGCGSLQQIRGSADTNQGEILAERAA